jgi:hypothetical protein
MNSAARVCWPPPDCKPDAAAPCGQYFSPPTNKSPNPGQFFSPCHCAPRLVGTVSAHSQPRAMFQPVALILVGVGSAHISRRQSFQPTITHGRGGRSFQPHHTCHEDTLFFQYNHEFTRVRRSRREPKVRLSRRASTKPTRILQYIDTGPHAHSKSAEAGGRDADGIL